MNSDTDPLATLRDIQLPADPIWWPPAIGWWILFVLLISLIVVVYRKWRRFRQLTAPSRSFAVALNQITYPADPQSVHHYWSAISQLVKQYAITRYGRHQVAALTGAKWLDFLNQKAGKKIFTETIEEKLGESLYQNRNDQYHHNASEAEVIKKTLIQWSQLTKYHCPQGVVAPTTKNHV